MQYKIALSDLSPAEKKGKYISYEPGKRKSLHELTDAEENNVNIVCDKNLKTVNSSNYYLQMFFLFLLVLVAAYVIYNGIIFNKSKPSKFSSKRSIRT
jgi:chromatin remodeling complex protein RSC6